MDPNELNELRELVEFLKSNDVAEFDLEKNDLKVRLKFMGAVKAEAAPAANGLDMATLARLMAAGSAAPTAPAQVASVHGVAEMCASRSGCSTRGCGGEAAHGEVADCGDVL